MTDKWALSCDSLLSLCNLPFLITAAWASIWGCSWLSHFYLCRNFRIRLVMSPSRQSSDTATRSSIDVFFSLLIRSAHCYSKWVGDWIYRINFLYFILPEIKLCLKRQKSKHDMVSLCDISQIYEFQSWNVFIIGTISLLSLCLEQIRNASERANYRLHSPN